MTAFLSDELEALRIHLTLKCLDGLSRDQVNILVAILKNHKDSACGLENTNSNLAWNLEAKKTELALALSDLDRAEALLKNHDPMYQVSTHVLDEIGREGSNVCLMKGLSNNGGGAGEISEDYDGGENNGGGAA